MQLSRWINQLLSSFAASGSPSCDAPAQTRPEEARFAWPRFGGGGPGGGANATITLDTLGISVLQDDRARFCAVWDEFPQLAPIV